MTPGTASERETNPSALSVGEFFSELLLVTVSDEVFEVLSDFGAEQDDNNVMAASTDIILIIFLHITISSFFLNCVSVEIKNYIRHPTKKYITESPQTQ